MGQIETSEYLQNGTTVYAVTGYHVRDGRYCRIDEPSEERAILAAKQYLRPGTRLFRILTTELAPTDR